MSIKILYVEDEVSLGKIVRESLESRGFIVKMESDGDQALAGYYNLQPDICLLDVMLPNRDGFEIAEQIRDLDEKVPIIFISAKTRTDDVVRGFSTGANDYIRKPFSMEELIVRIQNALRLNGINGARSASSQTDAAPIQMGNYRFFANRHILSTGEEERKLSFRENELLRYLYMNRDKVIDRKDILNLLWGNDSFFNSRNLDVYMTKLRSYLKGDETLAIITIKGIGYRFVTE